MMITSLGFITRNSRTCSKTGTSAIAPSSQKPWHMYTSFSRFSCQPGGHGCASPLQLLLYREPPHIFFGVFFVLKQGLHLISGRNTIMGIDHEGPDSVVKLGSDPFFLVREQPILNIRPRHGVMGSGEHHLIQPPVPQLGIAIAGIDRFGDGHCFRSMSRKNAPTPVSRIATAPTRRTRLKRQSTFFGGRRFESFFRHSNWGSASKRSRKSSFRPIKEMTRPPRKARRVRAALGARLRNPPANRRTSPAATSARY